MKRILLVFFTALILSSFCSHINKAQTFYSEGNYRATIQLCIQTLKTDSSNVQALTLLGDSYFAIHQLDSSLNAFNNVLYYDENNSHCKEKISKIYTIHGDSLFDQKKYFQAIDQYQSALKFTVNEPCLIEKIGDAYFTAGKQNNALTEYKKITNGADSVRIYTKIAAITTAQNQSRLLYEKGITLFKAADYNKAVDQFSKALEVKPDYNEALYQLYLAKGIPLYRKGSNSKLWDAIELFGLAAALYPEKAEPHYHMAMAYNKKNKEEYDNAISEFEIVIDKEPNSELAKEAKSNIAEMKKRRKKMNSFLGR